MKLCGLLNRTQSISTQIRLKLAKRVDVSRNGCSILTIFNGIEFAVICRQFRSFCKTLFRFITLELITTDHRSIYCNSVDYWIVTQENLINLNSSWQILIWEKETNNNQSTIWLEEVFCALTFSPKIISIICLGAWVCLLFGWASHWHIQCLKVDSSTVWIYPKVISNMVLNAVWFSSWLWNPNLSVNFFL